jgi:hypothetical protein
MHAYPNLRSTLHRSGVGATPWKQLGRKSKWPLHLDPPSPPYGVETGRSPVAQLHHISKSSVHPIQGRGTPLLYAVPNPSARPHLGCLLATNWNSRMARVAFRKHWRPMEGSLERPWTLLVAKVLASWHQGAARRTPRRSFTIDKAHMRFESAHNIPSNR